MEVSTSHRSQVNGVEDHRNQRVDHGLVAPHHRLKHYGLHLLIGDIPEQEFGVAAVENHGVYLLGVSVLGVGEGRGCKIGA